MFVEFWKEIRVFSKNRLRIVFRNLRRSWGRFLGDYGILKISTTAYSHLWMTVVDGVRSKNGFGRTPVGCALERGQRDFKKR